jgi:hypothetical protein
MLVCCVVFIVSHVRGRCCSWAWRPNPVPADCDPELADLVLVANNAGVLVLPHCFSCESGVLQLAWLNPVPAGLRPRASGPRLVATNVGVLVLPYCFSCEWCAAAMWRLNPTATQSYGPGARRNAGASCCLIVSRESSS